MKIDRHLRESFRLQRDTNQHLETRVRKTVETFRNKRWHFEQRLKAEETFAGKVEAGLATNPAALEDFLACVLVVPNLEDVAKAEHLVREHFEVIERRPRYAHSTVKNSADFAFDDVRLYLRYPADDALPPQKSDNVVFELQVRTFLQHAWSVSTHDTVYKSDSVSWARERVANQVKAMLEHAEVAIDALTELEIHDPINLSHKKYDNLNLIIETLSGNWDADALPTDLKRLAGGVLKLLQAIEIEAFELSTILDRGAARYGGTHNVDWSPYRAVLEYVVDENPDRLARYLRRPRTIGSARIFVYPETLVRLGLRQSAAHRSIVCPVL